ncbi:hypothetical protein ILUMI_16546 [Ignelater luminosus]|uniref:Uncharacterized protein n=1 Tax=Ignelater luminosus TaxID=2038154 RepID=A0A8K0CSQ9_IGNLU|nr:hypothetical protein ILUMI_16546 [Ignelater luminosus]
MEDQGFEFKFRWLLITYTGKMKLENGWMQGLATLERVDDCSIEPSGKKMLLKLSLTFTDLLFNYDYTAKLMGIGPKGGIDGSLRNAKFTIIVSIDTDTCEAQLEEYKLNRQGKMSVKFTGNPLADFLMNILSTAVTTFLWPVFRIFIASWVQDGVIAILVLVSKTCGQIIFI